MFDCSKQINPIIDYELDGSEKHQVILFNWFYNKVLSKLEILLNILLVFIRRNHDYCVMGNNHSHKVHISDHNLNQIYRLT